MGLGIVGMGIMGRAPNMRLRETGHTVYMWNRTRKAADAQGSGEEDYAAVVKVLERLAGAELRHGE